MSDSSADHTSRSEPPRPAEAEHHCPAEAEVIRCPACGGVGVEKKQKWFCARCGRLLQTCCD